MKKTITPKLKVPSWGDLQRMATSLRKLDPKLSSKLGAEDFYTLVYLQSIVMDDKTESTPFHGE